MFKTQIWDSNSKKSAELCEVTVLNLFKSEKTLDFLPVLAKNPTKIEKTIRLVIWSFNRLNEKLISEGWPFWMIAAKILYFKSVQNWKGVVFSANAGKKNNVFPSIYGFNRFNTKVILILLIKSLNDL